MAEKIEGTSAAEKEKVLSAADSTAENPSVGKEEEDGKKPMIL